MRAVPVRLSVDRDVIERINRTVVQTDFVMAMWRGRAACAANGSDDFATRHVLTCAYANLRHVGVAGRNAVAVVDHHNIAVTGVHAGVDDSSVSRGLDRSAVIGGDVQAGVVFITAAEGVAAHPETVSDVSAYRPSTRGRGEFDLVPVENVFDITQLALQCGGRLLKGAQLCFAVGAPAADFLADVGDSAYARDLGQFGLGRIKRGQPALQLIVLAFRFLILFLQLAVVALQVVELGHDERMLCETVHTVRNGQQTNYGEPHNRV